MRNGVDDRHGHQTANPPPLWKILEGFNNEREWTQNKGVWSHRKRRLSAGMLKWMFYVVSYKTHAASRWISAPHFPRCFRFFFQLRRKHGWFRIWYSDSSRRRFVRKRERETVRDRQEREVERQTGRQDRACCGFVQRRIAPRTGCTAHALESRRHYCWTRFSSRLVSPSFHFSDFPLMSQNEFWFDKASFHRQPSWPI